MHPGLIPINSQGTRFTLTRFDLETSMNLTFMLLKCWRNSERSWRKPTASLGKACNLRRRKAGVKIQTWDLLSVSQIVLSVISLYDSSLHIVYSPYFLDVVNKRHNQLKLFHCSTSGVTEGKLALITLYGPWATITCH